MESTNITLNGITWNHTRGYVPMVATSQRFSELNPQVNISWDVRSLQAFADKPVDELAAEYDLLVLDHPWIGFVNSKKLFLNLNNHIPKNFLRDQNENSVGRSYESYLYDGKQWALPVDAAAPVASSRPDLLKKKGIAVPDTYKDVVKLAEKGLVAFPAIPQDTLMNFFMFCSAFGEDPFLTKECVISNSVGRQALQALRTLAQKVDDACFEWNPIAVYEAMNNSDQFAYCPFAYGYVNYSKKGYASGELHFHDLVNFKDDEPLCTTLGGAGIAISNNCQKIEQACEYLKFVCSGKCQSTLYFDSGGQPGHLQAWNAKYTNSLSNGFFKETLPALERAYLRPRYNGHMYFQDNAGFPVQEYMKNGGKESTIIKKLNQIYKESLK